MGFSTTDKQLYIVELSPPFDRLEIQFVPASVGGSRSADLAPLAGIGVNLPEQHFTGGEETVNFRLEFFSDEASRDDVLKKINWLRSLTFKDGGAGPARKIRLVWGALFKRDTFVVKSVKYDFQSFNSFAAYLPGRAFADIQLIPVSAKNPRIKDVRG